jgi:hypothetical protein
MDLETNLDRFWEIDALESSKMTAEQKACEEHFYLNTTQQKDGRFVVKLPNNWNHTILVSLASQQRRGYIIWRTN